MALSDLVKTLLAQRGISAEGGIAAFLNPDYALHTHSPFLLADMDRAAGRILDAIERGERIAVYADFDCDGIPGGAVLSDLFAKIGYSNVEVYLPHRDREGYGFHPDAIRTLAERGTKLIITVDVGTTAVEPVRIAKELGIDTIITDHHEIPASGLPDAYAIINPKIAPYPFPHLCGAGVAFKLAEGVLAEGRKRGNEAFLKIPDGWEKWLLDLVAIATVADMVPLVGENRVLAHFGLRVLRKSPRLGISALCNRLRLRRSEITEDDIGFSIAPRINAASRMDEPDLALALLTTHDAAEADRLAAELESLNTKRKTKVATIVREARKRMKERYSGTERVVVLGNPEWKPALLGLAANSLLEGRRLPDGSQGLVCLWGRDATGRLKGSCRSDGSLSVVEVFAGAGTALEESGGHGASGGFSVSHESVHTLSDALNEVAEAMEQVVSTETERSYDALVTLREVSPALLTDIAQLSPYGVGNPKPIFRIANLHVVEIRRFGKEGNHLELTVACRESGMRMRAFDFFRSADDLSIMPASRNTVALLAHIERDTFRGGIALRLVDVVAE
jgi:single-stranded-DNA-specific exonuclease